MIGKTVKQWLKAWWLLLVPIAFASGAVLVYALTFRQLPATEDPGAWGTFGDFLGGLLNPLVSTLTLFVAASVWKLQREELELTRKELEQTKLAMEEQAKTAEQQRQEQRFFDLLNVYQRTVDSIVMITGMPSNNQIPVHYTGKEAVSHFCRSAEGGYFDRLAEEPTYRLTLLDKGVLNFWHEDALRWWKEISPETSALFDHYFRVIHHILTEAEALLGDQHIRYIQLFRAQLSRSELILLSFNLWLDEEGEKMLPMVEKYGLLRYLPKSKLRTALENLHPKVFGHQPEANL